MNDEKMLEPETRIDGQVAVITGANGGIGKATAFELARRGARVVMGCRNMSAGLRVRDEIISETGNTNIVVIRLDLGSLQSIRRFADDVINGETRVHILVNNAGVFCGQRRLTDDGFELDFGVNHLGHFLLTYLLLDKLISSAPSRVITVSSKAHEYSPVDLDDLQVKHRWSSMKAYGRSKTANVLFSTHLARLLQDTGVTTYCVHPGVIKTDLGRDFEDTLAMNCFNLFWKCFKGRLLTPAEGALTTIYCSISPQLKHISGKYYSKCRETQARSYATDPAIGEKLWRLSAELCRVNPVPSPLVSRSRTPCNEQVTAVTAVKI